MEKKKQIKVGLLVGEFFSNSLPFCKGKGGYGMLARNYIAEFIPCEEIAIDCICGYNQADELLVTRIDGDKNVLFLPDSVSSLPAKNRVRRLNYKINPFARKKIRNIVDEYDLFLSLEFSHIAYDVMSLASKGQKLILWIQDPRTHSDWEELDTLSVIRQTGYRPNPAFALLLSKLAGQQRLHLVSQGRCLIEKAREIYHLPKEMPVEFMPNPIHFPKEDVQNILKDKRPQILFLGRLDSVKRPWIVCEVAKQMPQYDFYFAGNNHEPRMKEIMEPYQQVPNCHFLGHIEGDKKAELLRNSMLLINTSIHEAVPISFLEALSYGTLLVSNRNPDNLTAMFGHYTGQINGEGYDGVAKFVEGIEKIMTDRAAYEKLAEEAICYIREVHGVEAFVSHLRRILLSLTVSYEMCEKN